MQLVLGVEVAGLAVQLGVLDAHVGSPCSLSVQDPVAGADGRARGDG